MTWTRFMDMHSGGGLKERPYSKIYIEAPEEEAKVIFYNRFGHSPERVSCTCCGEDYSIDSAAELWIATAYDRDCKSVEQTFDETTKAWTPAQPYKDRPMDEGDRFYQVGYRDKNSYLTVEQYIAKPDVLVIPASEIKDGERVGEVPDQGYVWAG
jgi:hypothetical protein